MAERQSDGMGRPATLAFASGSEDLVETFLDALEGIAPRHRLFVVSEFAPPKGTWIPWHLGRTREQNQARIEDAVRDHDIEYVGLILQPRQPFWPMRWTAMRIRARHRLFFNENLDHFTLHPRSWPAALGHFVWRVKNLIRWETRPGGWLYTQVWRLGHPKSLLRPILYRRALAAGGAVVRGRRQRGEAPAVVMGPQLPEGITVVVPSRNGRDLLQRLLPGLVRELEGHASEVVVVDNGSSDRTAEWLESEYPEVRCDVVRAPLSFAEAVNRGIAAAGYSRTMTLNNDMVLEGGFFRPLLRAFDEIPDLFCSTAQIFFPEGARREETGKAVFRAERGPKDYPVWCMEPASGEDMTYVLYGSGGCSLFDTRKLQALGGFDTSFAPAYVEDHDLGWRGWQQGWPTVFSAGARLTHHHRSTTRRYYGEHELQVMMETHHLKHLVRSVSEPGLFLEMWKEGIARLNALAAEEPPKSWAMEAMRQALKAPAWTRPMGRPRMSERVIAAAGSGEMAVFPGTQAQQGRATVLVASPYLPYPLSHGGAVRMYNLMKRAAREYDLVLIAFADELVEPAIEVLELVREAVLVRRRGSHLRPLTGRPDVVEEHDSPAFHAALQLSIRKFQPSLVQLEFTQMGLYAKDCAGIPTVLVEHDVTIDLYAQLLRQRADWETRQQYDRWLAFERGIWGEVDVVVTMSEKDKAMVAGARRVEAILNGVDLERFQPQGREPEAGRILFIGSFAHLPNLLALQFFLHECWNGLKAKGARLHVIAGARHEHYLELYRDRVEVDLRDSTIEVEGYVSDVREAYARAAVVIAPLLASAGTNIKIMEAMALGKAVVSTPAGINGLDLRDGDEVVVADTGAEMAAAILRLFSDEEYRRRLGKAARRRAEETYGWDAIARKQSELYRRLMEERKPAGAAGDS